MAAIDMKHLAIRINLAKAKYKWSFVQMEREIGVNRQTIRQIANGNANSMTTSKYNLLDEGLRKHGF
jgi:DNA-binding XRE family transcriptional regulator